MIPAYFRAFATRTALGRDLQTQVARLKTPTPELLALPETVALECEGETLNVPVHLAGPDPLISVRERFYDLIDSVIEDALNEAELSSAQKLRTGLFFGSSSGDVGLIEDHYATDLRERPDAVPLYWRCDIDNVGQYIRQRFKLGPIGYSINTACASSANAVMAAQNELASGEIDHALVVGLETFNKTTALGFQSLDLLTRTSMRPFDARRDGLILGEGCAAAVLSTESSGGPQFKVLGGSCVTDTYSISASNPNGESIAAVIRDALIDAGIEPGDIGAIKAHGTASLLNDEGESAGILEVFGEDPPPIAALKPYIGHTFGASGLCEFALLAGSVKDGFWPGVPGVGGARDELGIALNQSSIDAPDRPILLNHFGFGGVNTCLVVSYGE